MERKGCDSKWNVQLPGKDRKNSEAYCPTVMGFDNTGILLAESKVVACGIE